MVIHKIRADHVIDFAAEELKKYLRMMMPECGEIEVSYDPEAKTGFRLGFLEDFGLPNEAEEVELIPYGCAKLRMTEMPMTRKK